MRWNDAYINPEYSLVPSFPKDMNVGILIIRCLKLDKNEEGKIAEVTFGLVSVMSSLLISSTYPYAEAKYFHKSNKKIFRSVISLSPVGVATLLACVL